MLEINNIIFNEIPGFRNYMISEDGIVYSIKRDKIISQSYNWAGYKTVTITDDGGFRSPRKVHRLVYLTYIGPLEKGKVIDHIDNNKLNNNYRNLQQITPSENSSKSFLSGKNKCKVVWNDDMIHKICKMMEDNIPEKKIFKSLGVDYKNNKYNCNHLIGDLKRGVIHKHITCNYNISGYISSINKKDVKLTISDVEDIYIKLMFDGYKASELAKMYKAKHSTICKIRDKKTWKSLTNRIDNEYNIQRKGERSTTIEIPVTYDDTWEVFEYSNR